MVNEAFCLPATDTFHDEHIQMHVSTGKILNQNFPSAPLISVIIPTYNRAKMVKRAAQSVMRQDYPNFEVIIVDDGSTDDTPRCIREMVDDRLRYIRLERNVGGGQARNAGLRCATGEFVAFLDSDDEWFPSKLTKQIQRFRQLPEEYGLVYCGMQFVDGNGKAYKEYIRYATGSFLEELLVQNFIGTMSSVMVRKKLLDRLGGFDPLMKSCQDWDLYIRLMKISCFHCIDEGLVRYHIDKEDPFRISNRIESVLCGHIRLMEKFKSEYESLPLEKKIRHARRMAQLFLEVGDWERANFFLKKSTENKPVLLRWAQQGWNFLKWARHKIRKQTSF